MNSSLGLAPYKIDSEVRKKTGIGHDFFEDKAKTNRKTN